MAQNPTTSTTISLSHLPLALEKAVELAKQNHITDRHLWIGFEIFEADAAAANALATKIAHEIGGANAQPVVMDVGGVAAGAVKPAVAAAVTPAALPPHGKIIGLKFTPKA